MSRSSADVRRLLVEPDAIRVLGGAAPVRIPYQWAPDEALTALASDPLAGVSRGARWEVLFADRLVRYVVVRWPEGLRGAAEREAVVALRFREVHGIGAPDWRIAVERNASRIPSIASAVPATHVEAIVSWVHAHGLRLEAMTTEFISIYNRVRPRLDSPFGALAVQREGRITVGLWRDAQWQSVRSQPLPAGGEASLAIFLDAQTLRAGMLGERPPLYCIGCGPEVPPGWEKLGLGGHEWA